MAPQDPRISDKEAHACVPLTLSTLCALWSLERVAARTMRTADRAAHTPSQLIGALQRHANELYNTLERSRVPGRPVRRERRATGGGTLGVIARRRTAVPHSSGAAGCCRAYEAVKLTRFYPLTVLSEPR